MKPLLLLILFSVFRASAHYETRVYDSAFSSSSKVIINKDEIQDSKSPNMAALLSTKANINITNTAFQPNSLFVRGGDSSQVLILIDDIPVYDASTVQRSFNLNSVSLNSVERITVIKGSQSVWYGGQALSAVIKIDTLPKSRSGAYRVDVSGGSHDFREINGDSLIKTGDSSMVIFRGQYQYQNSLSPVEDSDARYKKRKDNLELVYVYRDDFQFNTKVSHTTDRNENVTGYSNTDYKSADTEDFISSSEVNQFQLAFKNNSVAMKPFLSAGFVGAHRVFDHSIYGQNQEYKGYLIPVRGELRLLNDSQWKWDIGASFQKEGMLFEMFKNQISNNDNEMVGTYTKLEWLADDATSIVAGYRYDTDLNFRDVSTYQIGVTYDQIKLEHSTGYRLPTLYQLFSNKGNSEITPEFARTYSLSYDYLVNENIETSISVFETHVENLIAARGNPAVYYNVGRTLNRGFEAVAFLRLSEREKLTVNFGYQEPKDVNTGRWLARRPLKSGSIVYSKKEDQTTWTLELVGRGERDDFKNSSEMVRLPGYTSLNSSYIFQLSSEFSDSLSLTESSIYFRGENLMSKRYDESYGFRNPGLEFFVGVRAGI